MIKALYICFIILLTGDILLAEETGKQNAPDAHGHASKLHDSDFITNEEHMKTHHEHEFGEENDMSKLSQQEREFRFFYSHDYNNDSSLDGLEMWHAVSHAMTEDAWKEWEKAQGEVMEREAALAVVVDEILATDDLDNNGYITYNEFSVTRRRETSAAGNSAKT